MNDRSVPLTGRKKSSKFLTMLENRVKLLQSPEAVRGLRAADVVERGAGHDSGSARGAAVV